MANQLLPKLNSTISDSATGRQYTCFYLNFAINAFLKFYRVYMGTANDYDDHIRARGANASIVGEPFGTNETKDMFLENQELKVSHCDRFIIM